MRYISSEILNMVQCHLKFFVVEAFICFTHKCKLEKIAWWKLRRKFRKWLFHQNQLCKEQWERGERLANVPNNSYILVKFS